jgi:hypothetical protein
MQTQSSEPSQSSRQRIGLAVALALIAAITMVSNCSEQTPPPKLAGDFRAQLEELGSLVAASSIASSCTESLKLGLVECRTTYDLTPGTAVEHLQQLGWQQERTSRPQGMVLSRNSYKLVLADPPQGIYLRAFSIRRT